MHFPLVFFQALPHSLKVSTISAEINSPVNQSFILIYLYYHTVFQNDAGAKALLPAGMASHRMLQSDLIALVTKVKID